MLKFKGHLFDTKAINKVLDVLIDKHQCLTAISEWIVGNGSKEESECTISLKNVKDIQLVQQDIS